MKLPAAILFDMDDTLLAFDAGLDVDACWRGACSEHLAEHGYGGDIEEVVRAIKQEARWYWSDPERHRIGRLDRRKARTAIIAAALCKLGIGAMRSGLESAGTMAGSARTMAGSAGTAAETPGTMAGTMVGSAAGTMAGTESEASAEPEARTESEADLGLGLGLSGADLLGLCDRIAVAYSEARDALVDVYPGAIDTLAHVRKLGIPIALLTNGASLPQRQKIERFGLDRIFETILVEEEFGIGKPEPEVYVHALRLLGVKAEEAWMVGDNYEWEIVAPQSLGIRGIWLNHRGVDPATLPVQPFRTIRAIGELIQLLDECRD